MITPHDFISLLESPAREMFLTEGQYMYDNVEFSRRSAIHGKSHCERVLYHALAIGQLRGHDVTGLEILAHAAIFHDSRRVDDFIDTGHGARAAVYYREFCDRHTDIVCHEESALLMRYHDLPDIRGIEAITEHYGDDAGRIIDLFKIFKDADGLDRWRLGDKGIDPRYLRTLEARGRISLARRLVEATTEASLLAETQELFDRLSGMKKMLLIVDPQVDFTTGSLPVPGAREAMDALAEYVESTAGMYDVTIVTADRHPACHCSFSENGGQWPAHCVADTEGEAIWPPLQAALDSGGMDVSYFYKGENPGRDEYSIFGVAEAAATIGELINRAGIAMIDICGLAGDVCVSATEADARRLFPDLIINVLQQYSPRIN